jgi:hypothetical protein
MIKYFFENPSNASRAVQIWQILISKAHNRQIMTYEELQSLLHYGGAGVFDQKLGHIMYFCSQHELPLLTALVVNKNTGKPGGGFVLKGDLDATRELVFKYDWHGLYPPSEKEFDDAWRKGNI